MEKNILSLTGVTLSDRMFRYYKNIFQLESEYKWMIFFPYATLLHVIQEVGIEKIRSYLEDLDFPNGNISIRSLQWNWNQPHTYFLNMKDAY